MFNIWYHYKRNIFNTSKTFVIQHPEYESKYLVHACLEGPEAGVYYRGMNTTNVKYGSKYICKIILPSYVENFSNDFTVSAKCIISEETDTIPKIACTKVTNNTFTVVSDKNCEFNWLVIGKRNSINIELNKEETQIKGMYPYTWI